MTKEMLKKRLQVRIDKTESGSAEHGVYERVYECIENKYNDRYYTELSDNAKDFIITEMASDYIEYIIDNFGEQSDELLSLSKTGIVELSGKVFGYIDGLTAYLATIKLGCEEDFDAMMAIINYFTEHQISLSTSITFSEIIEGLGGDKVVSEDIVWEIIKAKKNVTISDVAVGKKSYEKVIDFRYKYLPLEL